MFGFFIKQIKVGRLDIHLV